ncbi:hypothetical protein MBGDN05_00195 [Thermoplasmatales archaeon SCGC AB-539-N05]|nr:hypothetical protein MBGDN05_00195 [Thermoplasmatales archaeon SCGC AB-539-N05]
MKSKIIKIFVCTLVTLCVCSTIVSSASIKNMKYLNKESQINITNENIIDISLSVQKMGERDYWILLSITNNLDRPVTVKHIPGDWLEGLAFFNVKDTASGDYFYYYDNMNDQPVSEKINAESSVVIINKHWYGKDDWGRRFPSGECRVFTKLRCDQIIIHNYGEEDEIVKGEHLSQIENIVLSKGFSNSKLLNHLLRNSLLFQLFEGILNIPLFLDY